MRCDYSHISCPPRILHAAWLCSTNEKGQLSPPFTSHQLTKPLQDTPIKDAFRRGMGHAVQWYDSLRVCVEREVDLAVEVASKAIETVSCFCTLNISHLISTTCYLETSI
jgi:hypothetical protein